MKRALSWAEHAHEIEAGAYLVKGALFLVTVGIAVAQNSSSQHPPAGESTKQHESHREAEAFEAEFVASNIFRSGSYYQPLWRGLSFEGNYFGGETTDTAFLAGSWTFRIRELKLTPGCGILFGTNQFATSPGVSFRWEYERGWFVTQGLALQGFRQSPMFAEEEGNGGHHSGAPVPLTYVRPKISDGSHFSARWRRLEIGGTFEHIAFREGSEWKGGGRLAIRMLPRISALLYVLSPGKPEWRGGILVHSRSRE